MSEAVTVGLVRPFGYGLAYQQWSVPSGSALPNAGATYTETTAGTHWKRVLAVHCSLSTDANAANRLVTVDFINARGTTFVQNGASVIVTASTTGQVFEWSINRTVSEWNTNTPVWAPLADFFMPPAFQLKINVANIQVGDQLSSIAIWYELFPTGPKGYPNGQVQVEDVAQFTGVV